MLACLRCLASSRRRADEAVDVAGYRTRTLTGPSTSADHRSASGLDIDEAKPVDGGAGLSANQRRTDDAGASPRDYLAGMSTRHSLVSPCARCRSRRPGRSSPRKGQAGDALECLECPLAGRRHDMGNPRPDVVREAQPQDHLDLDARAGPVGISGEIDNLVPSRSFQGSRGLMRLHPAWFNFSKSQLRVLNISES